MGLDITIYKKNKKDKLQEIAYFFSDGWPIVYHLKRKLNKELYNEEVVLGMDDIREIIDCCKKILTAYYNRSFEYPWEWKKVATDTFDDWGHCEHDDTYIDNISEIYRTLWKIQEELYDNETVIFDISY